MWLFFNLKTLAFVFKAQSTLSAGMLFAGSSLSSFHPSSLSPSCRFCLSDSIYGSGRRGYHAAAIRCLVLSCRASYRGRERDEALFATGITRRQKKPLCAVATGRTTRAGHFVLIAAIATFYAPILLCNKMGYLPYESQAMM